jgi:hypothetical protein
MLIVGILGVIPATSGVSIGIAALLVCINLTYKLTLGPACESDKPEELSVLNANSQATLSSPKSPLAESELRRSFSPAPATSACPS